MSHTWPTTLYCKFSFGFISVTDVVCFGGETQELAEHLVEEFNRIPTKPQTLELDIFGIKKVTEPVLRTTNNGLMTVIVG